MDAAKKHEDKAIIANYQTMLIESKALLIHIGKILQQTPNVNDIERYGKWFNLVHV